MYLTKIFFYPVRLRLWPQPFVIPVETDNYPSLHTTWQVWDELIY